jgi:hypothetical protein
MSTPKPRIRPKADARPRRSELDSTTRDPPTHPQSDPPVFTERDPGRERKSPERVLFQEDDRLR